MRVPVLAAVAALTLSACGGGGSDTSDANMAASDANAIAVDNMMMDANASMNGAMMNGATMNGTAMDANMAVDPATQNMIQQDMNTNSPDTNLANGL
jgi:hypothetical protein